MARKLREHMDMSASSDRSVVEGGEQKLRLVAWVAETLFVHGETTEGVRRTTERLGGALGLPVKLTARWADLKIRPDNYTFGAEVDAAPTAVDIQRVRATEHLVEDVCEHRTSWEAATEAMDRITVMPPVGLSRFALMAAAGAGALSVIFGATDPWTVALTALSAGLGALLRRLMSRLSHNPFVQPFSASFLAGLIVTLAGVLNSPASLHLLAACPCMVLVPGPHFLNGAIDLLRARISLGGARILFALLIVTVISAGLLLGLSLGATQFVAAPAAQVPFLVDLVAAGVAVAAYGAFFNMPWRMLPAPIVIGMAAHSIRWYSLALGASAPMAALAACALVGCCMAPLSHRLRIPFGASAFAAVVSLIPGILMFQTAADGLAVVRQGTAVPIALLTEIVGNIASASTILLAMTAGIIIPRMLFEAWLTGSDRKQQRSP